MRDSPRPVLLFRLLGRVGLRAGLLALLAAALAIILLDRGLDIARERRHEVDHAGGALLGLARAGAERQASLIAQTKTILRLAANMRASAPDAGTACHDTFKRISEGSPWLRTLAVLDLRGYPVCASTSGLATQSFADRPYFTEAIAGRGFAVSDYLVSRVTNQPLLVITYPHMRNGEPDGVLLAAIDPAWMGRLASDAGATAGSEVLLLDRKSTVIAAYPDPTRWVGRYLGGPAGFTQALAEGDADGDGIGPARLDGTEYLVARARIDEIGATFAVMLPHDIVVAETIDLARMEVVKIVIGGGLAVLVIWLGSELLLIRPIRRLAEGAIRLGSGTLDEPISTEGLAPELRRLGETLNTMARKLGRREAELRRANRMLADLAAQDPVTGIANRRAFDERLASEWSRSRRNGLQLALLLIDVDHFKQFNDRFGHAAGDRCLRRVGEALGLSARPDGGFAARIGGEEFAVILPEADMHLATQMAERLRVEVAALTIDNPDGTSGRVTISVGGVAAGHAETGDAPSLFSRADAALYRAKRAGRNCVALDRPPISLAS